MKGITTKIITMPHENLIHNGRDGLMQLKIETDDRYKTYHIAVPNNNNARIMNLGFNGYTGLITISGYVHCDKGTCGLWLDVCDTETTFVRYDGAIDERSAIVDTTKRYFVATCKNVRRYNTLYQYNGFLDHNISLINGSTMMYFEKVKIEKGSWTETRMIDMIVLERG